MTYYDYPNQIKYYKDKIYNVIQISEINENSEIEEISLIQSDKSEEFEHDFEIV